MKFVTAVIKPLKLDEVRCALDKLDITGLTVSDVKGFGRQKGTTELYRGHEYKTDFLPKLKIEVALKDSQVNEVIVIDAISKVANTGKIGDGKIFVYDLEKVTRIRTGEIDEEAI